MDGVCPYWYSHLASTIIAINVWLLHSSEWVTGDTKAGYLGEARLRRLRRSMYMLNEHVVLAQAGGTATPAVEIRYPTCQRRDPLGSYQGVGVTCPRRQSAGT